MFSYTCEICETEHKSVDDKYSLEAWQYHDQEVGHCYLAVDVVCEGCASKVRDYVDGLISEGSCK